MGSKYVHLLRLFCYFFADIEVIYVGFVFRTVDIAKKIRGIIVFYDCLFAKSSERVIVFEWICYVVFVIALLLLYSKLIEEVVAFMYILIRFDLFFCCRLLFLCLKFSYFLYWLLLYWFWLIYCLLCNYFSWCLLFRHLGLTCERFWLFFIRIRLFLSSWWTHRNWSSMPVSLYTSKRAKSLHTTILSTRTILVRIRAKYIDTSHWQISIGHLYFWLILFLRRFGTHISLFFWNLRLLLAFLF